MRPVTKRITTITGAHWIKRATDFARNIRPNSGVKREIVDGYVVEGRRSGNNRIATVIDIPGRIALLRSGGATGAYIDFLVCGGRDAFSPIVGSVGFQLGEEVEFPFNYAYFGPRPPSDQAQILSTGHAQAGKHAVYYSGSFSMGSSRWLSVFAVPVGEPDYTRSFVIHESVIESIAPGYSFGRNTWSEMTPVVAESGTAVFVAARVVKKVVEGEGQIDAILLMRVDVSEGTLVYKLVTQDSFPEHLRATEFIVDSRVEEPKTVQAKSRISVTDCNVSKDGRFSVAFIYAFQKQDSAVDGLFTDKGFRYGTDVECTGSVSWLDGSTAANIYRVDCVANIDSQLVRELGLEIDSFRIGGVPMLLGESIIENARVLERPSLSSGEYLKSVAPFSEELLDGEVTAKALDYPFGAIFQKTKPAILGGVVVTIGTNKAEVSDTTIVLARANADADSSIESSTGAGILFTDGSRFRYESVADIVPSEFVSRRATSPIWVSCPQKEVRSKDNTLIVSSVVLVMTVIDGQRYLGVRKGPIWDGDIKETDTRTPDQYWSWAEAPESIRDRAAFYIGNNFNKRLHGSIFYDQKND